MENTVILKIGITTLKQSASALSEDFYFKFCGEDNLSDDFIDKIKKEINEVIKSKKYKVDTSSYVYGKIEGLGSFEQADELGRNLAEILKPFGFSPIKISIIELFAF